MSRLLVVRLSCLAAVLLMAFDKYSWGELNPPFGVLGDQPVGGRTWQLIVVLVLAGLLAFVALSAGSRVRTALRAAIVEFAVFLAFNCALLLRDGVARLAEWGYAETSIGLFFVVGGIAIRGLMLRSLAADGRVDRSIPSTVADRR